MGGNFSEPVPNFRDSEGYVCMILRSWDKFRVLHGPKEVVDACQRVVGAVSQDASVGYKNKHGAIQFRLPGSPFALQAGKESATIGKVFAIRVFEEMNHLGYDLVGSADLSRAYDQSSWFFRKSVAERSRQPVLCIAPGGYDKLVIVRGVDYVIQAVKDAISESWPLGIQREKQEESENEKLYEFKLRGNPWYGEGDESTACRKLLLHVIGRLARLKWRLLTATNLKGGTDSMFFIYDDGEAAAMSGGPDSLAMLSFNRSDRIRLINFGRGVADLVRTIILRFYQTKEPDVRDYYGATEFKLKGYPFLASGSEAIQTRQLICRLLEALRDAGWAVKSTVDISRKPNDKSVILFERCESAKLKFACLALSDVDTIRLLNFPQQVTTYLRKILADGYLPGVQDEGARDGSCYEMQLNGSPWSHNSSYNLHARSMLLLVLKEASRYGWQLTASADVSAKFVHQENGPDYPIDVHSWFFCYQGVRCGSADGAGAGGVAGAAPLMPPQTEKARSYSELRVSDLEEEIGGGGWIMPK